MKSCFSTPRRGFVVKDDGKLYEFKRDSVTVSRAWPPVRYQKTRKKPYWHYTPFSKLNYSYMAIRYSICLSKSVPVGEEFGNMPADWPPKWLAPLAKFYEPIPVEVRERMIGKEGADTPWNICAFFARCKDAGGIMRSSPATAYMLANLPVFRKGVKRRWDIVRRLAGKQRREILGYLGWPDTEAMAKIIARIPVDSCRKKNLLLLRAVVSRSPEVIKPLSHIRSFNDMNLEMICRRKYRKRSGWRLIDEVGKMSSERYPVAVPRVFEDTVRMEELLGIQATPIKSVEHLGRRHEKAISVLNNCDIAGEGRAGEFPPPPVPALPASAGFEIYPVDDPVKLCKEGLEQHNCVSSYCDEIVKAGGGMYIYSLRKPERATVKIEKSPGANSYSIAEIKGPSNSRVAPGTVDAVNRWLDAFSGKGLPSGIFGDFNGVGMFPEFPAPAPSDDKISIRQLREPGVVINEMIDVNLEIDVEAMNGISGGRAFAFLMELPRKVLIYVSKDKHGGHRYRNIGTIPCLVEKFLDAWMDKADLAGLAGDNPDQLCFQFETGMMSAGKDGGL